MCIVCILVGLGVFVPSSAYLVCKVRGKSFINKKNI